MSTILDLLYREYCRARLAEMRKQLLLPVASDEILQRFGMPAILPALTWGRGLVTTPDKSPNHPIAASARSASSLGSAYLLGVTGNLKRKSVPTRNSSACGERVRARRTRSVIWMIELTPRSD